MGEDSELALALWKTWRIVYPADTGVGSALLQLKSV